MSDFKKIQEALAKKKKMAEDAANEGMPNRTPSSENIDNSRRQQFEDSFRRTMDMNSGKQDKDEETKKNSWFEDLKNKVK